MMLVANSCFAGILFGFLIFSVRLFTLENDLKQIAYKDFLCSLRGYVGYAICSIQNCSYLLQSIYRFVSVVYPTHLFYQSARFQLFLICLTWVFGFLYPIAFLFTGEIIYNVDNQICQLALRLSFSIIYMANCAYIIPVSVTMFIYLILVRYVHRMNKHVTPMNRLARAQRELKMARRLFILVTILFILCFPYAMFILMSFFWSIPKYHFRIAYVFIDVSYVFVIIALFQFTDPLKMSIMKRINRRSNVVVATIT
ncbi:unnamed protein product [Rotaria sp. Silwood1]|nr:unnamed protein product [Rotaria sp. Silwood1]CAF1668504.1 unnamed protein product [Rotaria sp. Silwood1]CAF3844517.1 unnamed protein product [Rotaria sp. Silwood1]CAF3856088.1 unnamed protein product [Rotaria sp. Silwood1]CAF3897311.1 unnamed protein product [Rotaria sp. Silwood1]